MLTPPSLPKLDILVVDDDPFVRETIQIFLESEGLSVRTASCGEDGIAQLLEQEPDVALVDLRMPRMDGLAVLRSFKQHAPEVEVVMATGDATLESALSAMKLGAYSYIEKPIVDLEKDLLSVVRHAAERRHLRQTNRRLQGDLQLALHQLDAQRREQRIGSEGFPIGRLLRRCSSASPTELKAMILSYIPAPVPALLYLRNDQLLIPCAARDIDLPPIDAVLPTHRFSDPGERWREGDFPDVFPDQDEALMLPLFWIGELVGLIVLPVTDEGLSATQAIACYDGSQTLQRQSSVPVEFALRHTPVEPRQRISYKLGEPRRRSRRIPDETPRSWPDGPLSEQPDFGQHTDPDAPGTDAVGERRSCSRPDDPSGG